MPYSQPRLRLIESNPTDPVQRVFERLELAPLVELHEIVEGSDWEAGPLFMGTNDFRSMLQASLLVV